MKLKFKQQQYQTDATSAVVNCFLWQTKWLSKTIGDRYTVDDWLFWKTSQIEDLFSNKKLEIEPSDILKNVRNLQQEAWIWESKTLDGLNFTIEMETWTGKTYVYTKTILELNKQYGWSKFIIMVPSIAIREWVNKSLEITSDHFSELYGKKIRFFIYDNNNKSNLVNIKNFASSSNIEVIIMNYQAFATQSKESRKIYQNLDTLNSRKPIDVIKWTRPILIIDEPQRFWDKAESTLQEFHPLFTLRYSATHKKDFNKIYRLDAIDAYNQKLVKKIHVKWIEVIGSTATNSFLFLDRINISTNTYPTAHIKMEIEVKQAGWIRRTVSKIIEWDNLYELSNWLEQYKHFVVKEINAKTNMVSFTNWVTLWVWQAYGNVDEEHIRRIQIRETIKTHIEKERIMYSKWIKVLSLFFIDEVSKYRSYGASGNNIKWEYETIFEEEYNDLIQENTLFDTEYKKYIERFDVSDIHNGYFSIDKKWHYIDSKEKRWESWSDDVWAYDLIMKDKERLLSFSEPTRFIFSHSALREWWDNPNVFQICTLRMTQSTISKRQEIWRWLRICVNSNGDRMDSSVLEQEFFEYNTLTVIANESYESFARELQKEILDSLSNRPIQITTETLKGRVFKNEAWEKYIFDDMKATKLLMHMTFHWYIDDTLKVTTKCMSEIETQSFQVPKDLENFQENLTDFITSVYTMDNFKAVENAKDENVFEAVLKPNDNFYKKEFQELWNKINHKTSYEVKFDTSELIQKSVESINSQLQVSQISVNITIWGQEDELSKEGLKSHTSITKFWKQTQTTLSILWNIRYDLVGEIMKNTLLTRKTLVQILSQIHALKFDLFKVNPEDFIRKVSNLINDQKAATLINNIVYTPINQSYESDIFTINNFKWSLKDNIIYAKRHIYDYLKTDSQVERDFANELETWEILVYAKLPSGFKIPTPIWNYNPDWAIVIDKKDIKYIYFIAETKWSLQTLQLKWIEDLKIQYARKHFESLWNLWVKYEVITNYKDLISIAT